MSTALTTINGAMAPTLSHSEHAFEPGNLSQALELAKVLHAGGLLPKTFSRPEAVVTAIILGRELGLSAMQSIRGLHVIEGKPCISADMKVALVKRSPLCRFFRLVSSDNQAAVYETHREGDPEPTRLSFTMEDARAAGVTSKDNWRKFPAAMLRARCSSALAGAVYQDLVMGIYDPDELEPAPRASTVVVVDDRTVSTVTGEVLNLTAVEAPAEEPAPARDALDVAQRRLRAIVGKACKAFGMDAKTGSACVKEIIAEEYGKASSKDCTPDELHRIADRIEGNPNVLFQTGGGLLNDGKTPATVDGFPVADADDDIPDFKADAEVA